MDDPNLPEVEAPEKPWTRYLRVAYFILIGILFSVVTAFAAPSFWYVPVAVLLLVSGFLWLDPRAGASASLPLCLALVFMLIELKPWQWPQPALLDGFVGIVLTLIGLALCLFELLRPDAQIAWKPFAIFTALAFVGFLVDRAFTNRVEIRSFDMSWVADGKDPGGDPADPDSHGQKPIFVFMKIPGALCYDAVFYEPLRQRLNTGEKPTVHVEYNEFRTWGRITSYNVHSIDGLEFNRGRKILIPNPEGYGGTILAATQNGLNQPEPPPCPR
jgi:hypothetical protein